MARDDQLRRCLQILQLLERAGGMTVAELSREVGVHPRTVYRYIGTLQEAHFPLVNVRDGRQVQWSFMEGFRLLREVPFSLEEVVALEACRDVLGSLEGSWVGDAASGALRKVRERVAPEARALLDAARSALVARVFGGRSYGGQEKHLQILLEAIQHQRRLRMIYDSRTAKSTMRRVDPYVLFLQDGCLYLVAHDERRREPRTFAVHRIRMLEPSDDPFVRPTDFSLDDYLRHSFRLWRGEDPHQVCVRLSAAVAPYAADRKWHPSQKRTELPDGRVELHFEVAALEEIRSWLLGFGGEAEAVSPPALRQSMLEAASRLQRGHTDLPAATTSARKRGPRQAPSSPGTRTTSGHSRGGKGPGSAE